MNLRIYKSTKRLLVIGYAVLGLIAAIGKNASGAPQVASADSIAIQQQLNTHDSVRIIIGLNVPFGPAGALDAAAAVQQANTIAIAQQSLLSALSADTVLETQSYQTIPYMALTVSNAGYQELLVNPLIKSVELDRPEGANLAESVPRIGGDIVWLVAFTGAGQVIAILDTGVQKTHPFIGSAKVVAEACFGANYAPDTATTFCPNANSNGDSYGAGTGVNCSSSVSNCNHGTHVAGIAAGNGANAGAAVSFSGVAKDAKIAAVQVFSRVNNSTKCSSFGDSTPCALYYTTDLIAALEWVYQNRSLYNFAAVNMSLGGGKYSSQAQCDAENLSQKAAIDNLRSVGIAVVISSGNNGYTDAMQRPGCISSAISVGSTDDITDQVKSYSNSASFLNLLAPGSLIYSSVPNSTYENYNGTSMAAPHVAGAFALMKQAYPTETVSQLLNRLATTGKPVTDSRNNIIKPRINLAAALPVGGGSYALTVTKAGTGSGTVSGGGSYAVGATVNLIATPASGSTFAGWSPSPCAASFTMPAQALTCTATFTAIPSSTGSAVGVFRNGQWFLDANGNGTWDSCGTEFCFSGFGQAGDRPASGNWDGGAKSYVGVLRSSTGQWFIDRNGNRQWDGCVADGCYSGFGAPGDLPVAGDWNGTGFSKIGVFRNGQWYLDANGNGKWDGCGTEFCLNFGQAGDLPVAGNWNGGVSSGVGVFRAGTWYLDYNGNGVWDGCGVDRCYFNSFGQAGDLPAAGDWNGDGKAKVGVFRAGTWYLDYNGNGAWDGCGVDRCYMGSFGQAGDWPVAGKW